MSQSAFQKFANPKKNSAIKESFRQEKKKIKIEKEKKKEKAERLHFTLQQRMLEDA